MRKIPAYLVFILGCLLISASVRAGVFTQDTITKIVPEAGFLDDQVDYKAEDSTIVDLLNQRAFLYNHAVVKYQDMTLEAGYIEIDFKNKLVHAKALTDSTGKESQKPVFQQGNDKFTAGKISYNFDTRKGKINDVITQQGDGFIHGRDIKKDTNNTYYVAHGKYTTCDLEHPHYYIGAKKIKVIPNDKIITGPAELYIADIPTPLAVPFGYFPNKKGRRSGIVIPSYGESDNLGFFLKKGGFYYGGNEFVDLALLGDVYSNGSFGLQTISNYKVRYRYSGRLDLSYSKIITGDRELPNSTIQNVFFVRWNHTEDPKAHPSRRFSASVNAGSSSYNKYNGNVTGDYLSNTFQSNIAYSKTFSGTPFNFSANARHSQNTITKKMDITLPELALSMNRIYPFRNNKRVETKWYDKIGISATANARNDINTYDSLLFKQQTIHQMRNGIHMAVPISTTFNLFKYFTLTPTINAASSMYFQTIRKHFDSTSNSVITDTLNEVKMANEFSTNASLSTRIYGDYFFKGKHLKQIRHVATPTITASYRPDFSESQYGYYQSVKSDTLGNVQQYSIFQNGIFGTPPSGPSGTVAFSLNNTFEGKYRKQSDSGAVFKKFPILDNLGASVVYNAAATSFNWSMINVNMRSKILKAIDINANMTLDPYQMDLIGRRMERYEWNNGKIGRIVGSNISVSTSIRSKDNGGNSKKVSNTASRDELDYINSHPEAYVDFNIPWSFNVYYNVSYSKPGLTQTVTQSATFNGDISLTKKWKISVTSGYDFTNNKMTLTSINVYRDLHCWEMRVNWVPFGFRQSYSIDINVKSSVLRDLKLSRRKDWYDFQ